MRTDECRRRRKTIDQRADVAVHGIAAHARDGTPVKYCLRPITWTPEYRGRLGVRTEPGLFLIEQQGRVAVVGIAPVIIEVALRPPEFQIRARRLCSVSSIRRKLIVVLMSVRQPRGLKLASDCS